MTLIMRLVLSLAFVLATLSPVAAETIVEGRDYIRLSKPVAEDIGADTVLVREFFWYGCPHCYILEPQIQNWKKPASVEFITTPAVLGKQWVDHAYAYYALDALGKLDELHPVLFEALHDKKQQLFTRDQLTRFFSTHGIDEKQFSSAFASFAVDTRVKTAQNLAKKYSLRSVPTITVNGKYITSPSMVGYDRLIEVVEYLIALEAPQRKS